MVNTMKKIVGLVKSGALKDQFEVEIEFDTKSSSPIFGRKIIYSPKDSVVFLKDLMNEIKIFEEKESLAFANNDLNKYPKLFSMFDEKNINLFTNSKTAYNKTLITKVMTITPKRGKKYSFPMDRKSRGAAGKIAKVFNLD